METGRTTFRSLVVLLRNPFLPSRAAQNSHAAACLRRFLTILLPRHRLGELLHGYTLACGSVFGAHFRLHIAITRRRLIYFLTDRQAGFGQIAFMNCVQATRNATT